ncbi:hypothetical protein [Roseateles sp.]|uniref:hypothetical protein n=1 Tax=Roseateles sp. TaxID=1971397 RepID=UPI0031DDD7AD
MEFVDSVKALMHFLLPGMMFAISYWIGWPVARSSGDYIATLAYFVLLMQAFGDIAAEICRLFSNSNWIFGAYGADCKMVALCGCGLVIGIWVGRFCKGRTDLGYDYYPWFLEFR